MEIRPLTPGDRERWDGFVQAHPHGSPFHLIAWKKSMEEVFGYAPRYLMATDGNCIRGVLPLFLVKNFIMGKVLISSPFAVYGGILAETPEAKQAMGEQAMKLGRELGVEHIELRNAHPEQVLGVPNVSRYVTFTREVTPDEDAILAEPTSKKRRNTVRKALKADFSIRIQHSDYRAFEDLHSRTLRRLGTPNFPPRLFPALLANFGGAVDIREVVLENKVVAASMNFFFRDQMHTYYAASDPRYLALVPNDYMYYEHLRWAGKNGYRTFDFGRSKLGTGTADYKRHWGATMRELPYEILLVKRKEVPNYSPQNPKFQLAIKIWQQLPLPVTRALGPQLVKLFP
ncbi:MAG TPA: FemAB family XrtA/PEP-CTERM system-associated protein [Bryobacteraceae bacterium]|nr:FemAB family XrtA/PEP-CTERM system-associated protein [Bryobacteraceae bacterium]